MANEKDILIKPGSDENLHSIMEALEGISARTKELGAVAGEYDEMKDTVTRLQERCDELDKQLPQGGKVFTSETPDKTDTLREFGGFITEGWRLKTQGRTSAAFQRAGGTPGQKIGPDGDTNQTSGGVTVPEITYDKVVRIIEEASIVRKIAQVIPMTSNTMVIPTRTSGPTVSWLTNEMSGGNSLKTSVVFGNPTLTSKTLMAIDEISAELDEDSIIALEPFFAQVFAEAVGKEENKQCFNNNNSGVPFTSIPDESGLTGITFEDQSTAFSDVRYNDLLKLQYSVDSKVIGNGVFVMHANAFKEVVGLKDSNGRPIFSTGYSNLGLQDGMANQQLGQSTMLLGRPCYLTDTMDSVGGSSKLFALYGDFSKFAFGDRKQLSIDWSDQVYYEYGNLALRVRERIAMKTMITSAFAKLTTS